MKNKKGVSTIVAVLILIVLVLVAIGIVWAVVSSLINKGVETIDVSGKCISITISPTSVDCSTPSACLVTLERSGTGSDEIGGVKLVFSNTTAGVSSSVLDSGTGNIEQLVPETITVDSGLSAPSTPDKLESTVYFIDESGDERLCTQTITYTI